jgi:hypothetical protein
MALTEDNGMGFSMPVTPMYGNNSNGFGWGGDGFWIILLFILLGGNGWGNNGYGSGTNGLYPWLNQSEQINDGFRDQMLNTSINGIQNAVTGGFSDVQMALCNGFAGVEAGANARQMADMNRSFALQSQLADCCCENRLASADLKYTIATENCADRTQSLMNTRDIIDSQTRGTQAILDKLCALELDGVKAQLAQAERDNLGLQNQLNMAAMQNGLNNEVDALYNRLKNCPVPSMPVYGNTPIFTCGQNQGCGCGCNGGF